MARRKSRRSTNIQPSELTLNFPLPLLPEGSTARYMDLSQITSMVNRRFYRQGLNWAVAGFTLHSAVNGSCQISRIPSSWMVSNAWEKTMRTWKRQQDEAIAETGAQSAVAAFRDFKVFADSRHLNLGIAENLLPAVQQDAVGQPWVEYLPGEWDPSLIVIPNEGGIAGNTQEFYLTVVGDDDPAPTQSKSLIKNYALSRAYPQSPDPVSPNVELSIYSQMFDDGETHSDVLDNATDRNDELPYPQIQYPGADVNANGLVLHDLMNISATTVSGKTSAKGGSFPCGLLRVDYAAGMGATLPTVNAILQVHLVPGSHRGYLAESMTEM